METSKAEIKCWLEMVLGKENVAITSVSILGNPKKGENFIGDVIFVDATGVTNDNNTKKYNLVLKCSKRNELLREKTSIKAVYLNEIFIYEKLLPSYTRFQLNAGIQDIFDNVPKYYGTITGENMEVIVLENLRKNGYYLWEKKKPMPRKYINLVVRTYGKLHGTAAAMINQEPEQLEEWREAFKELFKDFKNNNGERMFESFIDEVYSLLKDNVDEDTLQKWYNMKGKTMKILNEIAENTELKVIVHGDCWNNNFMFQSDSGDINLPSKVVILDWQMSRLSTPIIDLAYFLFACISEDELENLNSILDEYYESFAKHLKQLGCNSEVVYPKNKFLNEWQKYSKVGLLFCGTALKICVMDKDETPDVEAIENGRHFLDMFKCEIKDAKSFRNRIRPIVKYAAENGLI